MSIQTTVMEVVSGMLESFDDNISKSVDILTKDIFTGKLYETAEAVSLIIKPIALIIISVCFLLEFLRITATMDILKWEYAVKLGTKLILSKVCIDLVYPVCKLFYFTTADWIRRIGGLNNSFNDTVIPILESHIESLWIFDTMAFIMMLGIVFLVIFACGIVVLVISFGRMFEIMIMLAVSPIPCAMMCLEGNRITKNFFLRFAGNCLQGVFIVVAFKFYSILCEEIFIKEITGNVNIVSLVGSLVLSSVVLATAIVKSGSWAKSLMDVT